MHAYIEPNSGQIGSSIHGFNVSVIFDKPTKHIAIELDLEHADFPEITFTMNGQLVTTIRHLPDTHEYRAIKGDLG